MKHGFLLGVGVLIGMVWYYLYLFPIPQLAEWKSKAEERREAKTAIDLPGRWRRIDNPQEDQNALTTEQKKMIKQLESMGYLSGSKPATQEGGVTQYDDQKAWKGMNLVTSAHRPEATLMDMEGNTLHTWSCTMEQAWPDFKPEVRSTGHTCWRRINLMENGDLLAIFEGVGIIKLDKNSNLIWSARNGAHHDLYVTENCYIWILKRKIHINPKYHEEKTILEDFVALLDRDGNTVKQFPILETLENTLFAPILNRLRPWGDITHSNTIELIEKDGPLPVFKKGRLILSILLLDLIFVDLDKGAVWAETDLWTSQHQPTLLDNGHLLMFDNRGFQDKSRVIEFDPITKKIQWVYGGVEEDHFFTPTCGSCQRLPNGNTLITESDPGRAFEVTRDRTLVWEYLNPHRAGEQNELIATLYEVVRLTPDFPMEWLE